MNEKTFFEDDEDSFTGPPVSEELVAAAESRLGVVLPRAYVGLLAERNGGVPRRRCFRTPFSTSWATDHFEIRAVLGVGGKWGVDSSSGLGSVDLIAEWGYPAIGVVICNTPSGGHDTVMLDYSASGPDNEPSVAYIDENRVPRIVADTFDEFVAALVPCDRIATEP
jgi:hypothetical protein